MITQKELDKLVKQYETKEFIKDDPIQIPHRFETEEDITISAFVTSCFAYGNRKVFIENLNELFERIDNQPYNYVVNFDSNILKDFNYRFSKDIDVICFFKKLQELYKKGSSLKQIFEENYKGASKIGAITTFYCFIDRNDVEQSENKILEFPNITDALIDSDKQTIVVRAYDDSADFQLLIRFIENNIVFCVSADFTY